MPSSDQPLGKTLRRIITGENDEGRSIIVQLGGPNPVLEFFPGAGLYDICQLGVYDGNEQKASVSYLEPQKNGIKFRWFTVLPEAANASTTDLARFYDEAFSRMSKKNLRPDTSRHPGMHKTNTVDLIIVVQGQVRLLLDEDDIVLGAGDVVVQRGTNHAWIPYGPTGALLAAVLIDKGLLS